MKLFFLVVLLGVLSSNAWASGSSGASATMPIKAKFVNLTTMPLEEALAFCDERSMPCPALREKYEASKKER